MIKEEVDRIYNDLNDKLNKGYVVMPDTETFCEEKVMAKETVLNHMNFISKMHGNILAELDEIITFLAAKEPKNQRFKEPKCFMEQVAIGTKITAAILAKVRKIGEILGQR